MREFPGSSLWGVVSRLLGTQTMTVERVHTLSGGTDTILRENPRRLAWLVCNLSTGPLFIRMTRALAAGQGMYVPGDGGTVAAVWYEDGEGVGYEVVGEGSEGGVVYVQETIALL